MSTHGPANRRTDGPSEDRVPPVGEPPDYVTHASDHESALPYSGRILAIDLGEKRIGLALSDPTQTIAQPLATLMRRTGKRFPLKDLREHLERHRPAGILIGLPLTPAGDERRAAIDSRTVGALITEKTGLPVAYWDERMSTARALGAVRELGGKTKGKKQRVDPLAATVFLQAFLDARLP